MILVVRDMSLLDETFSSMVLSLKKGSIAFVLI